MSKRLWVGLLSGALALTLALPGAAVAKEKDKDACKKGGWADLVTAEGQRFANSGACIDYVEQGGRGFLIAIAYSNLNGQPGYQAGSADVLIARLLDMDGNGVDAGDRIVMGSYPTDLDASGFASWGVTEHIVAGPGELSPGPDGRLYLVTDPSGCTYRWWEAKSDIYSEQCFPSPYSRIEDSVAWESVDAISTAVASPSQPSQVVDVRSTGNSTDDVLIDVDILLP